MRYVHLDILRAFAILSIVFFHTTGMLYANHFPDSKETYSSLYFVFNQCYLVNFAMVVFTALSGYLFAISYDVEGKYRIKTNFLCKKLQRLILPYIIFTPIILYTSRFQTTSFQEIGLLVINFIIKGGYAHLWYLPCLFWCFVIIIFIYPYLKNRILLITTTFTSFMLAILLSKSDVNVWGLMHTASWFYFFLLGVVIAKLRNVLQKKYSINIGLLLTAIVLMLIHKFPPYAERDLYEMITLTIAMFPIFFLSESLFVKPYKYIKGISKYSFGIYIFHCWIAPYLISSTAQREFHLAPLANQYIILFPISFFVVTFLLSFVATYFFQKTKLGKYILG